MLPEVATATVTPPEPVGPFNVTVQVVAAPRPKEVGLQPMVVTTGAVREMVAVLVDPLSEAVRVADWLTDRLPVETLKVAADAFARTVTEVGAVRAAEALLETVTAV